MALVHTGFIIVDTEQCWVEGGKAHDSYFSWARTVVVLQNPFYKPETKSWAVQKRHNDVQLQVHTSIDSNRLDSRSEFKAPPWAPAAVASPAGWAQASGAGMARAARLPSAPLAPCPTLTSPAWIQTSQLFQSLKPGLVRQLVHIC